MGHMKLKKIIEEQFKYEYGKVYPDMRVNAFKPVGEDVKSQIGTVHLNTIKGGLSDKRTISDIAKLHNVSVDDIKVELHRGMKVEMEHTDDKRIALEIAMDHLVEDSKYYSKLATIESIISKIKNIIREERTRLHK